MYVQTYMYVIASNSTNIRPPLCTPSPPCNAILVPATIRIVAPHLVGVDIACTLLLQVQDCPLKGEPLSIHGKTTPKL